MTYFFDNDNQERTVAIPAATAVEAVRVDAVATNTVEGHMDPLAVSAQRMVVAYGDALHRLSDT